MKRTLMLLCLAFLCLVCIACDDTQNMGLALELVTPDNQDPFEGVVRLSIKIEDAGDKERETTYPFEPADGFDDLSFRLKDLDRYSSFELEVRGEDIEGQTVSRGQSTVINSSEMEDDVFSIYFAKVNGISTPPLSMGKARNNLRIVVPGYNDAVIIGGSDTNIDGTELDSIAEVENFSVLKYTVGNLNYGDEDLRLASGVVGHSASYLDSANILVLGGYSRSGEEISYLETPLVISANVEEYLIETKCKDFNPRRTLHAATTIPGFRQVFITGGVDEDGNILADAALYDDDLHTSTKVFDLKTPRRGHTQVSVFDGNEEYAGMLICGGTDSDNKLCEWWSVDSEGSRVIESDLRETLTGHSAATISNGRAIMVGGTIDGVPVDSALLFRLSCLESGCDTLKRIDSLLETARSDASLSSFGSGLLLCGGRDASGAVLSSCEVLMIGEDAKITHYSTIEMAHARVGHSSALLPDGNVLIAGGWNETEGALDSMEIYTPQ